MLRKKQPSVAAIALLMSIASAQPLSRILSLRPAFAQSPQTSFTLPAELPADATLQVDGSTSMAGINEALQTRFQERFPDTEVEVDYNGSAAALEALRNGEIDVAAIGRPLTDAEKTEGLVEVPVSRNKIAIVVGPDNPLPAEQSLTIEQFAQLFRGELTDWSTVGGTGTVRLVDRPDDSDTRQAFQTYPVFQSAPFETGDNAVQLSEDSTDAMVEELGSDGIGYAIVDQVVNRSDVRIVPMHQVLPTDERYPFSQRLVYVYNEANPEVQAFLATATAPENATAIEEAREDAAVAPAVVALPPPPSPAANPDAVEAEPTETEVAVATDPVQSSNRIPWWLWWLSLPLLGGLLWWLAGRGRAAAPVAAAPVAAAVAGAQATRDSRIILVPRNCREAYVYWEVPEERMREIKRQGGERLQLRIYDVTSIDIDRQAPHTVQEYDCSEMAEPDRHIPIPTDDRDYIADLGYVTKDNRWLSLARSSHVRVPACEPNTVIQGGTTVIPATKPSSPVGSMAGAAGAVAAGVAATAAAATAAQTVLNDRTNNPLSTGTATKLQPVDRLNRIILVPRNCKAAYAYWEISDDHRQALRRQGGRNIKLRIYDVTNIDIDHSPAHSMQEYDCAEFDQDRHVPILRDDRDYLAELGYVTQDGRWLRITRSSHVHVPACVPTNGATAQSS
ncbi:MAG: DUF4912 domain-containing protein [Leptolyngbyaceae cyanobacterium SL_7_1]|nr:DUF4912 domain-containing protein [Leptolyngbyaceae cyanobacterium SL_7_1]